MVSYAGRAAWPVRRVLALAAAVLLVLVSLALPLAINGAFSLRPAPDRFNVAGWELRHFPGKWLYGFNRLFHGKPSVEQENAALKRFFDLTFEIDNMETAQSEAQARGQSPEPQQAKDLLSKRDERASIQREVQRILQGRLTRVIEDEGITRSALVTRIVWPPVDFDFTDAPRMLAISPRDRIFLQKQTPLREGISLAQ